MNAIQLEFEFDNEKMQTPENGSLLHAHARLDDMQESHGKVRRSLFAKVGLLEKLIKGLQMEVIEIKQVVQGLSNGKTDWIYSQGNNLFDVQKPAE